MSKNTWSGRPFRRAETDTDSKKRPSDRAGYLWLLLAAPLPAAAAFMCYGPGGPRDILAAAILLAMELPVGCTIWLIYRETKRKSAEDRIRDCILQEIPVGYAVLARAADSPAGSGTFRIVAANPVFYSLYPAKFPGDAGDPCDGMYSAVWNSGHSQSFCLYSRGCKRDVEIRLSRISPVRLALFVSETKVDDPVSPEPGAGEKAEKPGDGPFSDTPESDMESFGYTISHEFKSPIRAIDGYARIFMEDYGEHIDPDGLEAISNIRSICRETIVLVNKLLDFTRIAGQTAEKSVVDIRRIMEREFDKLCAEYGAEREVKLIFDTPLPSVLGDSTLFAQAVENILSNALKFTRDKPAAVISAGYTSGDREGVYYVRDNGAGFDMKYSEKLFGMFQRMHSSDEFEGSGIGLVIVKKIIQKHGGRVWITGEVGKGATVYFAIPREDILTE